MQWIVTVFVGVGLGVLAASWTPKAAAGPVALPTLLAAETAGAAAKVVEAGEPGSGPRARPRSGDQAMNGKDRAGDGVDSDANGVEISGLLVDRTLTKGGHDFYDAFIRYLGFGFESPYTLTVTEEAGTGRSTFVTVLIADTPVFQSRLNPLPNAIEELAETAADQTLQILADTQNKLRELDYY